MGVVEFMYGRQALCKTKTSKLVPGQILSVRELQMYANVCAEMKCKPNTKIYKNAGVCVH